MNTILVVDDEPAIRDLLDFGLRLGGFQVRHAASGQQALALYRQEPKAIQLVILDIGMPGLDGPSTFETLRQINPAARCCFITGYACESTQASLLSMGALHVFQKPIFSVLGFVQQVRQLISGLAVSPA